MLKTTVLVLLVLCGLNFVLVAKGNISSKNLENSEKSLITAIESENRGLSVSSIQILGELNSINAVLPLLKVLHNSNSEEARIAASVSLYKIGDKRGIYAVKMASKYDNSKRVRNICTKIYSQYLTENKVT